MPVILRIPLVALGAITILTSCSPEGTTEDPETSEKTITNRLSVPPDVVANLGITFAEAKRGKIGIWIEVPGELRAPERSRWTLRAPAAGRLLEVVQRWKPVETGEIVAEMRSPALQKAQQSLLAAYSRKEHALEDAEAAGLRLTESQARLKAARALETASLERLERLRKIGQGASAFSPGEILEAQRLHSEASRSSLEAAVRRDELRHSAREKELIQDQAQLQVRQALEALSLLSGRTEEELLEDHDSEPRWKGLASILVRAPARGVVVDVHGSPGDTVLEGKILVEILDPEVLHFRGWLPEADLGSLRSGAPVRVELPGGAEPILTELIGPLPVADTARRRVGIEAKIPNPDGVLPQGLSASASVQIRESQNEEVLIPENCVIADGLEMIVFRRDPADPDSVIRTPVELGLRGAGSVEVLSGVLEGDSVVQAGIHQLKQTGLGKAAQGGHFHADGTWHSDHE